MKCPKCSSPLQDVDLGQGAKVYSCTGCSGTFYPRDVLAIEIALSGVKETTMQCPACDGRLRTGTMYEGRLELEQCEICGGIWLDAGEVQTLRSLSGHEGILKPDAHAAGLAAAGGAARRIERFAPKLAEDDDDMSADAKKGRLTDSGTMANPDASRGPTVDVDGVKYKHFQTSIAEVTCALGEFHWKVAVGEQARTRDFIAPPYLLSNEVSGKDSVWSKGRYLEGSEVWAAFGLEGSPPHQTKVAPAQPNPWEEAYGGMAAAFWISAVLAVVAVAFAHVNAADKTVLAVPFVYDRAEAEKSKVTPEFELDGRTTNVEIVTDTNLDNHWAYVAMALINSQTDEAFDFGREVSYYHGSDSDGPWSEGAPYDRAVVPNVPPGHYYLRAEPEDGDAQTFNYRVTIRRDVPQWLPLLFAWALLAVPFGFAFWRRYAFEVSRWADSDHPWVTDSSDSDDD